MMCRRIKMLAATTVAVGVMAAGAFAADTDTAYVPFIVNVDATVTAVSGDKTVEINVTGNEADTLPLPLVGKNSARNAAGAAGRLNAPAVTNSRGNITLRLPAQSYQKAEISLHAVNGKRILRGKAAASETVSGVSRRNVAAGVYMLSVKGTNGSTFTTRLTHSGGKMNINVAFGAESASQPPSRQLGKKADVTTGSWEITVSAEDYKVYTYTLGNLAEGSGNPLQVINLTTNENVVYGAPVTHGGETYQTVVIGTQTWLARNLNYETEEGSVCYDNVKANCDTYGRLYDWNTAKTACPAGWHLPTEDEWETLLAYVDPDGQVVQGMNDQTSVGTSGQKLKATSTNGTDEYGFMGLSGGRRTSGSQGNNTPSFGQLNSRSNYWTYTLGVGNQYGETAVAYGMRNSSTSTWRFDDNSFTDMHSVRCVLDD